MSLRRLCAYFAAFAVIIAIMFGVGWLVILDSLRGDIEQTVEEARAAGYAVAYDDLDVGGFPWRMVVTVTQPSVGRPESASAASWQWSASRLTAVTAALTQAPDVVFTLPESQRLDYGGRVMEMTLKRGVAIYRSGGVVLESLTIEADGIALATPKGLFSLDRLTALLRRPVESRLEVEIDGRDLTLAPQALAPETKAILGRHISVIGVTASHDGDLPEDLSVPALAAWSGAGGTVEFERLNLAWGALEISAEGTLTLDRELRPEAAFSAEIAGYGGLLDGLAESGRMKPRDASFAKTFLNLLAKEKSGRRVVKAPITAQNGKLFVGPLPLLRLAPIIRK